MVNSSVLVIGGGSPLAKSLIVCIRLAALWLPECCQGEVMLCSEISYLYL